MATELADPYQLSDPDTLLDPYPLYARLRADAPAYFAEVWNSWLITRYDDVVAAFRDPRLSANRTATFASSLPPEVRERLRPILENLGSWILFLDPPSHTRLRGLINKAFTPRLAEALRPRVQTLVDGICDRVEAAGQMDVVADLASPLPVAVIGAMLGVRPEDGDRLKGWSNALGTFLGAGRPSPESVAAALRGIVEMETYLREVIAERRKSPQEDFISALIAAQEGAGLLDDRELLSTCSMVLFGGHETTTNLISNAVDLLLTRPAEQASLRDTPAAMPAAVEEFLRYETSVQRMGRVATEDMEIAGGHIAKGQLVFLMLGSANRDSAHFPDADRLDLGRRDNRHLSFGIGTHYCVGAALGRLETELSVGTLLRRFPKLRAAPEAGVRTRSATLRGFTSLPVLLG